MEKIRKRNSLCEIKFRAWWPDDKIMENWTDILETDPLSMYFTQNDRIVLMQFTGLFDRNGKEIYEGDVIEYKIKDGLLRPDKETMEVRRVGSCFSVPKTKYSGEYIEVIGNVYQDAGLIEK